MTKGENLQRMGKHYWPNVSHIVW